MADRWRVYVMKPRKRESGWYLRARPPTGSPGKETRASAKTVDRSIAEELARRWEEELNATLLVDEDPSFNDVFTKHIRFRETDGTTKPTTIVHYEAALRRLTPYLAAVRASGLSRAHVLRAQDALRVHLAPGTVNQTMNCARHAWGWAHERGLVKTPWPKITKLKASMTDKRPFTDEEVAAVLAYLRGHLDGRWHPFFSLLADTGCRVGELCALVGADVDRERFTITVRRSKTGEGRVVAVPEETIALVPHVGPGERVFKPVRPHYKGVGMKPRVPLLVLRRTLEALKLPEAERLDVHSLRRAWISTSLRLGVPLPLSMKVTGHTSHATHMAYQRRAVGDDMHEVVRRVKDRREASSPESSPASPGIQVAMPLNSSEFPPESLPRASC